MFVRYTRSGIFRFAKSVPWPVLQSSAWKWHLVHMMYIWCTHRCVTVKKKPFLWDAIPHWWRKHTPLKPRCTSPRLHGVVSHTHRSENLTSCMFCHVDCETQRQEPFLTHCKWSWVAPEPVWTQWLIKLTPSRQGRIKLFGAHRQWKHFRPLFKAVFLSGGSITPQTESNTTSPSPKTEITNISFYILNFA